MERKDDAFRSDSSRRYTRKEYLAKSARTAAAVALTGSAAATLLRCGGPPADFDFLIRGGSVYDGIASSPRSADVGIRGDRIAVVGDLSGKTGARTINATGCIVTPGFIDIHTHCDLTFLRSGMKRHLARFMPSWKGNYNYIYQGVATVVTGNCGYGYTDTARWLDEVESIGFGSNVMHLVPHGAIREELGLAGAGVPSSRFMRDMKRRIAEEMEKGAAGLSCGLAYAPGFHATTDELVELAAEAGRHGGIFTIHLRDESGAATGPGMPGVIASIREAVEIAEQGEIPMQISHLKIMAPYGDVRPEQLLELIEGARRRGLDVTADQYPYDAGSTGITFLLPNEFVTSESVLDEYKTAEGRRKVQDAIAQTFAYLPPEKTLVTGYPGKEEFEGKTIKQIAKMKKVSPAVAYADMVCGEEKAPMAVFFNQRLDYVRRLMPRDYVFTASDGWTIPKNMMKPHPRLFGTFARKLKTFAMDEGVLSLGDAIRSMTSLPAAKFGIKGRGIIAPGNFADVAVIDTDTLGDHSTFDDPHRYSTGVKHLLVNGVAAITDGEATGDRGGKALRFA